ncbi:MAG: hypothetical protein K0R37_855, partial [Arthrobacter sp.]|nr:hypothetical protein [Arthrobacter sp.]
AAASALVRQIEGRPPLATAPEFAATLVRRGSVGIVPADSEESAAVPAL